MSSGVVDEIKNKLDVVELIGGYLKLAKAGRNYKARCPFHMEKSPSFMVSPERQMWHCFGCGLGGDIFSFVMKIEGVEFGDALRQLARKTGVLLQKQDPQIQSQRKRLYEICELAAKFFSVQLAKSAAGAKAKQYLIDRGLTPETIEKWRLGWAPDDWHALGAFLKSRGFRDQEISDAGLAIKKEENFNAPQPPLKIRGGAGELNRYYDRFRSRIMFPLFDIVGQVVGFAGRIFGKDDPNAGKYINTPQTALYDKSRVLYGLNFAKLDLRQKDACVFVEGNLDVIMSHQAGARNAVATSGTALTSEHLKIIKRYTDNILFAFDSDPAGESATKRSIELALAQDFNIRVIGLPDKDPADMIKRDAGDWQRAIENNLTVMNFLFSRAFAKFQLNAGKPQSLLPEQKKEIAKILLPIIKNIPGRMEQSIWLQELAGRLKAQEKDLLADLARLPAANFEKHQNAENLAPDIAKKTRVQEIEERILCLCLKNPQCATQPPGLSKNDFNDQNFALICEKLLLLANDENNDNFIEKLKNSLPPDLKTQVDFLALKLERGEATDPKPAEEFETCLRELAKHKTREKLNILSMEIKEAQTRSDKDKLSALMEDFKKLSQEL